MFLTQFFVIVIVNPQFVEYMNAEHRYGMLNVFAYLHVCTVW